jgi:CRISPR/Cas system CSM-associated protein Csm3 (group 7 of RAMP superfamily)
LKINNIGNIQKLRIWTLSPLHIGDGTEFDPTAFWIDESRNELNEFDASTLFEKLSQEQKNKILTLCQKADIFSLQEIMKTVNAAKPQSIRKISVSPEIVSNYKRILNNQNQNEMGKFQIKKTIVNPNSNRAYISGSSLKGAIRTALIADLSKKNGQFKDAVDTTFKASDFISRDEVKTTIGLVDRVSKKMDKKKGGFKHMAVTMLESINANSIFNGSISLNENVEQILNALEAYSISIIEDSEIGIKSPSKLGIEKVKNAFKNKTYLCRLGGYIGAESHTIEGYRSIAIKTQTGFKNREHTTRLLYSTPTKQKSNSDNTTFGWCLIEVVNENDDTDIQAIRNLIASMQPKQSTQSFNSSVSKSVQNQNSVKNINQKKLQANKEYSGIVSEKRTKNGGYFIKVQNYGEKPLMNYTGKDLNAGVQIKVKFTGAGFQIIE